MTFLQDFPKMLYEEVQSIGPVQYQHNTVDDPSKIFFGLSNFMPTLPEINLLIFVSRNF